MAQLLDQFERPLLKSSAYEASMKARRLKSWIPAGQHINTLLQGGAQTMRSRSRQMVRDNPYASNAVQGYCANLIGTGIKPSSLVDDVELQESIQDLWFNWVDEADADWRTDFYGIQTVISRALFESGEVFVRFRNRRPQDGLAVPLQLQILEAEQLPMENLQFASGGNQVRCGIEIDRIGRRVAYHFYKKHPGDSTEIGNTGERVRIPASEILHIFEPLRPGQLRGQPRMVAALVKMYLLDQYDDAELDRKKVAALFAGFITSPELDSKILEEDDDGLVSLEPAILQKLLPGEDIKFSEPAEVGGSYEAFQYRTLLAISSAVGIPYTILTGDLRQVNYSSIRAGLVEFRRRMNQLQKDVIVYQFCRPVWRRWIQQAVMASVIRGDRKNLQRKVKWIPPKWEWVDPLKEIQAIRMMIRSGIQSRDNAIEQMGLEPAEVDASIAIGNQRADDLGLVFDSDPRRVSSTGIGQDGRTELPGDDDTDNDKEIDNE